MTKTAPKSEPSLADILAAQEAKEAQLLAEAEAAEAEAKAKAEALADEKAKHDAIVEEALAPYREQRDSLLASLVEAKAARAQVVEPLQEKHAKRREALEARLAKEMEEAIGPHDEALSKLTGKLEALTAKVLAETGAPEAVFNMDIAPAIPASKPAGKKGASQPRMNPVVADLGILGPYVVSTEYRRADDSSYMTSVVYQTRLNEDGALELCARRVDEKGVIDKSELEKAQAGDFTHHSTRASEVTTNPGFQPTKDVLYALCSKAGILGDFPKYRPQSAPESIYVDGEPLAEPTSAPEAEVTIEETV